MGWDKDFPAKQEPQPSLSAAVETLEKALERGDHAPTNLAARVLYQHGIRSALQQLQSVPAEKERT